MVRITYRRFFKLVLYSLALMTIFASSCQSRKSSDSLTTGSNKAKSTVLTKAVQTNGKPRFVTGSMDSGGNPAPDELTLSEIKKERSMAVLVPSYLPRNTKFEIAARWTKETETDMTSVLLVYNRGADWLEIGEFSPTDNYPRAGTPVTIGSIQALYTRETTENKFTERYRKGYRMEQVPIKDFFGLTFRMGDARYDLFGSGFSQGEVIKIAESMLQESD
ncbi:MAG: hypothetical protein ACYC1U_08455 [Candidatus Aquicultorales bacterium]